MIAGDGLTIRWSPGTDSSGELGNVSLLVNGEAYQSFHHSTLEAKLGAFAPGDTRAFTLSSTTPPATRARLPGL